MTGLAILPGIGRTLAIGMAAILWVSQETLGADRALLVTAAAILLVGLPHGGLDRILTLGPLDLSSAGLRRTAWFILGYMAGAAATIAFWLVSPMLGLSAFLAVSLIHFGLGDRTDGPSWFQALQVIAHGGAPIVLIPVLHSELVAILFAHLSDPGAAGLILRALRALLPVWLVLCLAYAVAAVGRLEGWRPITELALLAAVFAALPPLLGFLVYFGAVHGPRHMSGALRAVRMLGVSERSASIEVAVLSAIAAGAIVVAVIAAAGAAADAAGGEERVVRGLFIGLAALTVPHMILVDLAGGRLRDMARTPG